MKRPRISHKRLLELVHYDPETGVFSQRVARRGVRSGHKLGNIDTNGYRRICIELRQYLAHRLAWFYVHGVWPAMDIDHRDMDRDNNRIANLREATASQNHRNTKQPQGYSAPLKGAHWNRFRGYWQSQIKVNGKTIYLGRYPTAEQAHEAYMKAAIEIDGEFARAA